MAEHEWSNDIVIKLIQEYKQRPMLWDTTHELYRAQTAKYEAWSELAGLFECDIADLKRKMSSIFASHRREKAKVRSGGRSSWFLYSHMAFLRKHSYNEDSMPMPMNTHRTKALSAESEQSSDNAEEEDPQYAYDEEVIIKQEPVSTIPMRRRLTRRITNTTHKPRLTRPLKRRMIKEVSTSQLDSKLVETLKLLRRSEMSRKKDECDSFGEYIADSLRKHDDRTQSMIKQAINNILFEQEMKKYNAAQYVVISGIDENPLTLDEPEK